MKALDIIKSTVLEINKQLKKEDEIIVKKNSENSLNFVSDFVSNY